MQNLDIEQRGNEVSLDTAIKSIIDGNALLLTGSGAAYGATSESGKKIPVGTELARLLLDECNESPSDDLRDAADTYAQKFGEDKLINRLKSLLNVSEIQEWHKIIYTQNWRCIYTTNYDRIPVIAADQGGRSLIPVTVDVDWRKYQDKKKCVYINGIIDNLNHNTLNSQFKLNSSSWQSSESFAKSSWNSLFENDVDAAEYVFIVGLSLEYDLDLERAYQFNNNRGKTIIITSPPKVNPTLEELGSERTRIRKLSRYGTVFQIGIQGLAEKIVKILSSYAPSQHSVHLFSCFEHYRPMMDGRGAGAEDVYSLFMYGNFAPSLLVKSGERYTELVTRHDLSEIMKLILDMRRIIYIHSDFSNGKSVLLEEIADTAFSKGKDVYIFKNDYPTRLYKDIEEICKDRLPKIVIIDAFNNRMNVLRKFSQQNYTSITFVLAARTGLMNSMRLDVDNMFSCGESDSFIFDVNRLKNSELTALSTCLVRNGLWGELARLSPKRRVKFLADRDSGASEFKSILLALLKAPSVKDKLDEITESIKNSSATHFKALLIIMLSRMLTLDLTSRDVNEIVGANVSNDVRFLGHPSISQIITRRQKNGQFEVKSSVVAKFILERTATMNDVVDVLAEIVDYCIPLDSITRFYNVLRNLISFSLISTFVNGFQNHAKFMVYYYETLCQKEYYKENQFFWLQFAMVLISIGDENKKKDYYLRAKLYLDTALSLAESKHFVPFQIHNQQARLSLKLILNGFSDNVQADFVKAHDLLKLPITSSKDNPIMVVNMYKYYIVQGMKEKLAEAGLYSLYLRCGREAYNNLSKLKQRMRGDDLVQTESLMERFFQYFGANSSQI